MAAGAGEGAAGAAAVALPLGTGVLAAAAGGVAGAGVLSAAAGAGDALAAAGVCGVSAGLAEAASAGGVVAAGAGGLAVCVAVSAGCAGGWGGCCGGRRCGRSPRFCRPSGIGLGRFGRDGGGCCRSGFSGVRRRDCRCAARRRRLRKRTARGQKQRDSSRGKKPIKADAGHREFSLSQRAFPRACAIDRSARTSGKLSAPKVSMLRTKAGNHLTRAVGVCPASEGEFKDRSSEFPRLSLRGNGIAIVF